MNLFIIKSSFHVHKYILLCLSLERCYIHNIFTTHHRCKIVIGSNLNSKLKLLFYLSITTNYLRFFVWKCCKNIVEIVFHLSLTRVIIMHKSKFELDLFGNEWTVEMNFNPLNPQSKISSTPLFVPN